MKVQVRLFARYRETAGPRSRRAGSSRGRYGRDGVGGGDEPVSLALGVPPVHVVRGGQRLRRAERLSAPERSSASSPRERRFRHARRHSAGDLVDLVAVPLSEQALLAAVEDPGAGAVVLFSGVVRDQTGGRRVKFLEYEAHAPMAVAKMREIAAAARQPLFRHPPAGHRPPRGAARDRRVERAHRGVHRPPGRGLRRLPLRHRHAQGDGADLEEGIFRGRRGVGGAAVGM